MRARDRELGRRVAIKELLRRSDAAELRFFREAMITARLEHPGIVPVHEAGRWPDGTPFYAMKLVAGRPLTSLVEDAKTLEQRLSLVPHVIAVADAVAYAHSQGIIHRDLKPANIIVGEFGETVVIDWGLAKQVGAAVGHMPPATVQRDVHTSNGELTIAGSVLGTPAYMPPEQAAGADVDERADIFALGAVLLNVLTGASPASEPSRWDSQVKVPSELRAIIHRAMSPMPADRYRSARDFVSDLRAFHVGLRVLAHDYHLAELLKRWANKHRTAIRAALVAAIAVVTTIAFAIRSTGREKDNAARLRSESEQRSQQLLLARARMLLLTDPTTSYQVTNEIPHSPGNAQALALLKADAFGRGIAQQSYGPTSRSIRHLHWTSNSDRLVLDSMMDVWSDLDLRTGIASPERGRAGTSVLALDADRRQVIYQGPDYSAYIYNLDDQSERSIGRVGGAIWAAAFSLSGDRVAATTNAGEIVLWDIATGTSHTWHRAIGVFHSVRFSPDGELLATCGRDGALVVWSVGTLEVVMTATCDGLANIDYEVLPGNKAVLVGTRTGATFIHRIDRPRRETGSQGHLGPQLASAVVDISQYLDSSTLLVSSAGEVVRYRADVNDVVWRTRVPGEVTGVVHAKELRLILLGRRDGVVSVLDDRGEHVAELLCGGAVVGLAVSPDGYRLATATAEGVIRTWELPPARATPRRLSAAPLFTVRFSPDGTRVGVDSQDGHVYVCAVNDWACHAETKHDSLSNGLAWSSDSLTLASSGWDGMIRFSHRDGDRRSIHVPGADPVTLYDWAANGGMATLLRRNRGWEVADFSQPATGLQRVASFPITTSLDLSGNGEHLVAVESSGRLSAFVPGAAPLQPHAVIELGASSTVAPFVIQSWSGQRIFVDLGRGKRFLVRLSAFGIPAFSRMTDRDATLASAVFTRRGDHIALSYTDGLIELIGLDDNSRHSSQPFPHAPVSIMANRRHVVAIDAIGTLWAFDITESAHCMAHSTEGGRVTSAALSPDGSTAVAVSDSGRLLTFQLRRCNWMRERLGNEKDKES
jgi:serine/threonine protein kinase